MDALPCVLCALCNPFGKEPNQALSTGISGLDPDLPSSAMRPENTLRKVSDMTFCMLRKQFRGTGSLPVFLEEHVWTWESKHSYSDGSGKESRNENFRGGNSPMIGIFYVPNQFPKFVFSTSQINFPNLYFLHPKSVSVHFSSSPA